MTIKTVLKGMLFITMPLFLGGATYYVNGRPVYVDDYNTNQYYSDYSDSNMFIGSSTPVVINNGPVIIIRKERPNTPPKPKDPNFNSGEKKLPNNGISRPGTPYFKGDGTTSDR